MSKKGSNCNFEFAPSATDETTIILAMFTKISLQLFFEFLPVLIGNMFIGHISNSGILMAACGIARSFTESSASGIAWGFTTALKTLLPQCIGMQSMNDYLISIYVQRASIITCMVLIPLSILQIFAGQVIECIYGKTYCDANGLCHIICIYCRCTIPYIWFRICIAICQRIGQNLQLNTEISVALFISCISCIPLNYFLIFYLQLGFIGAAVTTNIVNLIACLLLVFVIYLRHFGYIFVPKPLSKVCSYNGMKEYIKLALPGTGRAATEFFIFEIYVLLSAFVHNPNIAVSASTILYGINLLSTVFAESLGLVLSVRIGKYVGAASIQYAKRSIFIGFIFGFGLAVISSLMIYVAFIVYGEQLIRFLWINNDYVVDMAQRLMYVVLFRNVIVWWYYCLVGVFSGIGYPQYPGYGLSFCCWFIALPIEFILLFVYKFKQNTEIALFIIWSAPAFARTICSLFLTIALFCRMDWNVIIAKSQSRILMDATCTSPNYGSIQ